MPACSASATSRYLQCFGHEKETILGADNILIPVQFGPENAGDDGQASIPHLSEMAVQQAIHSYVLGRMVHQDKGFEQAVKDFAMPEFCTNLSEWNAMLQDETRAANLMNTRYRLFLVLPPDFHEKLCMGMTVRRDEGFSDYHTREDAYAYYGANRDLQLESPQPMQ